MNLPSKCYIDLEGRFALYNILLGMQWTIFILGLIAATPLFLIYSPVEALLSLILSLVALANLKLDVVSLAK